MYVKELHEDDFKKYINYDSKCITQITNFIPDNIILAQVCEIFHYYINSAKNIKMKSPSIFFLSLLYGSSNIKDILNQITESPRKFLVQCCADEKYSNAKITSKEMRLKLSKVAISSLDSLL
mgnify:CR=1 FL=1